MTKVIGQIEKYDGNNVYVARKTFFIPAINLPSALANFPAGTVIALDTMPKQPGTVDWIRLLTKDEKAAYEKTKMTESLPTPPFQTGSEVRQGLSKVPPELDREREEYNTRAKATKPDPAPVIREVPPAPQPESKLASPDILGAVEIGVHINMGNYSAFDLKVTGNSGEQARNLLIQESEKMLPIIASIMREATKASKDLRY
jgi:hypothetical protein